MKNIFILFYLLVSTLLLGENITISYPKNKMSYHFYKDLTTNKYSGNYAYLFDEINKDNRYEFKYELENDVYNEERLEVLVQTTIILKLHIHKKFL